jgi:hypothetical protein
VAFLAFMFLKFKNKEIHKRTTPNDPKKLSNFAIVDYTAFCFGLHDLHRPFYFFLKSLISKKASGMQKCHI